MVKCCSGHKVSYRFWSMSGISDTHIWIINRSTSCGDIYTYAIGLLPHSCQCHSSHVFSLFWCSICCCCCMIARCISISILMWCGPWACDWFEIARIRITEIQHKNTRIFIILHAKFDTVCRVALCAYIVWQDSKLNSLCKINWCVRLNRRGTCKTPYQNTSHEQCKSHEWLLCYFYLWSIINLIYDVSHMDNQILCLTHHTLKNVKLFYISQFDTV